MFNCYLCHRKTASYFLKAKQRKQIKCASCNLVFLDLKTRNSAVKFFDNKFLEEYALEENLFRKYFINLLDKIEHIKKGKHILDIGCGMATFLVQAKKRGWKVFGIDSSKAAANYARKLKIRVNNDRIENINLPRNKFDVITAFQAIEHFTDPTMVLNEIYKALKPGGIIVMTTPNRESVLSRLMGRRWFGYYNREHLFIFDQRNFRLLATKAGFRIIQVSPQQGRPLSPLWVLIRLADYYYDHRSLARNAIKTIIPLAKHFDRLIIREPQVDLLLVAQKPIKC